MVWSDGSVVALPLLHELTNTLGQEFNMTSVLTGQNKFSLTGGNLKRLFTNVNLQRVFCSYIRILPFNVPVLELIGCNDPALSFYICKPVIKSIILMPTMNNTTCPPGHFRCLDNSCILNVYYCDGDYDCPGLEDEIMCKYSPTICDIRQCSDVFITNVMERHSHPVTLYTSQKAQCYSTNSSVWNDLIPDCFESKDEPIIMQQMYTDPSHLQNEAGRCKALGKLPCWLEDYPACYALEERCMYDKDSYGRLKYCRTGKHLYDCVTFECNTMYKCTKSYCIPWRMTCDGTADCVNGIDEQSCTTNRTCPSLFRCKKSTTCLHLTEICDHIMHCPNGDDEQLCGLPKCPAMCSCYGKRISCRRANLSAVPVYESSALLHLIMSENAVADYHINLVNFRDLASFDISKNILHTLDGATFALPNLMLLNLSFNNISILRNSVFKGMPSLTRLIVCGNPIKGIYEQFPFPKLQNINLENLQLMFIDKYSFKLLYKLKVLNIYLTTYCLKLDMIFQGIIIFTYLISQKIVSLNTTNTFYKALY